MLRTSAAFTLALLLLFGCQPSRPALSARDCPAMSQWRLSRAKKQTLLAEMYDRMPIAKLRTPCLLRRYCVSPVIVNQQQYGLYFVNDLSHQGPICVINGRRSLTVIQLGLTAHDTRDSVRKVLTYYQADIDPILADSIVLRFN